MCGCKFIRPTSAIASHLPACAESSPWLYGSCGDHPLSNGIHLHHPDEQPNHADSIAASQPGRNHLAVASVCTHPPASRPLFRALPVGPGRVPGLLLPLPSSVQPPLLAAHSISAYAPRRGHGMLPEDQRLYADQLLRDLRQRRSHARSGAEVRSSTVHPFLSVRL